MHELTALELGVAIKELKGKIDGSFLKKFYDLENDSFKLLFYKNGASTVVYCRLCVTFNETRFSEEAGPATAFAMAVRKRVEGARVKGIEQYDSDRIAIINFEQYRLVFEMFGKGNLVVLGNDGRTELAYKSIIYKDRIVKPKTQYTFPKSAFADIYSIDGNAIDRIIESVKNDDDKLIVALSRHINIGPIYLEELIKRAGLNPKEKINADDTIPLKESILNFLHELIDYAPRLYTLKDGSSDYSIVALSKYRDLKQETYESMNKLLDSANLSKRTEKEDKNKELLEEANANVEKQKALAKQLADESVCYRENGNKIFGHMHEINELIEYMKTHKRAELRELQGAFPNLNIKGIDLKNKIVSISLE